MSLQNVAIRVLICIAVIIGLMLFVAMEITAGGSIVSLIQKFIHQATAFRSPLWGDMFVSLYLMLMVLIFGMIMPVVAAGVAAAWLPSVWNKFPLKQRQKKKKCRS